MTYSFVFLATILAAIFYSIWCARKKSDSLIFTKEDPRTFGAMPNKLNILFKVPVDKVGSLGLPATLDQLNRAVNFNLLPDFTSLGIADEFNDRSALEITVMGPLLCFVASLMVFITTNGMPSVIAFSLFIISTFLVVNISSDCIIQDNRLNKWSKIDSQRAAEVFEKAVPKYALLKLISDNSKTKEDVEGIKDAILKVQSKFGREDVSYYLALKGLYDHKNKDAAEAEIAAKDAVVTLLDKN